MLLDEQHDIQKFARYEFKYLLDENTRCKIEEELQHFMTYDGFAHEDMDNSYFVRSLYYDTPDSSAYKEKTNGQKTRMKFRVRTYVKESGGVTPIFLEEKGRLKDRTFKTRMRINNEDLKDYLSVKSNTGLLLDPPEIPLIQKFLFQTLKQNIRPVVLVDYIRRPYVSPYDAHFRVTFDSNITALKTRSLFPEEENHWGMAVAGYTIMEVKFFRRVPAWFHRILQVYNLRRISISKFCKGMEVCGIADELKSRSIINECTTTNYH